MDGSGGSTGSGIAARSRRDVTEYGPANHEALCLFLRDRFGADSWQASQDAFAWRFAGPSVQKMALWVCSREGRVVGQQAGLRVALSVGQSGDEHTVKALWAIDLMVDPAWRLRGVAPALMDRLNDAAPLVAGLGISPEAHRAFLRAGWTDLGRVPRFVRLLRPLQAGQAPVGSWTPGRWAARLSRAAVPLLAGYDSVVLGMAWLAGCRFDAVDAFDDRVDALWQSACRHWPVVGWRDAAYLAWRFDTAPQAGAYERYYLRRGTEVIGYAVLRRERDVMTVIDYFCAPRWLPALFVHCLTTARRKGARVLTCLALPPWTRAVLRGLGFLRRSGPRMMMRVQDPHLPLTILTRPENWHITDADSDLDHRLSSPSGGRTVSSSVHSLAAEGYAMTTIETHSTAIAGIVRAHIIANFLFGDDGGLKDDDSLLDAGALDSTGVMELVAYLEEQFTIVIQDQDLVPENLDSINRIAHFVTSLQSRQTASATG